MGSHEVLAGAVADYVQKSVTAAKLKVELGVKQAEFQAANATLLVELTNATKAAEDAEGEVRLKRIELYWEDGVKEQVYGIGVRVNTKFEYDDKQAFSWAREHDLALKLDDKAFKEICGTTQKPEFVVVHEVPTALISKELVGTQG